MRVFSRSYLDEIIETQGQLFEYVGNDCVNRDTIDFITTYMNSRTRALIDEGQAYLCTMDAETLYHYFLQNEAYQEKHGKSLGGFAPNWIGQFYALFQWLYEIPSKEVVKLIPVSFLLKGYPGLHDFELEVAVRKVGRKTGLLLKPKPEF